MLLVVLGVGLGFLFSRVVAGLSGAALALALTLTVVNVVWWVRGARGRHIDEEILVPGSPEVVFAILDDPAQTHELHDRVARAEVVGDRIRHHLEHRGRAGWFEVEVLERAPPHRLVHKMAGGEVAGRHTTTGDERTTYDLEPAGDGTRVRLRTDGAPRNPTERYAIGARHERARRMARAHLRRLRGDVQASEPAREP